jgi:hypothetical protein
MKAKSSKFQLVKVYFPVEVPKESTGVYKPFCFRFLGAGEYAQVIDNYRHAKESETPRSYLR